MYVVFKTFTRLVIISSLWGVVNCFYVPDNIRFLNYYTVHTSLNVTYPSKPVITLGFKHKNESIMMV